MIQIAVVDDEEEERQQIGELLHRYARETDQVFSIHPLQDGADLMEGFVGQYQLVFLDIEMPITDGLDAAAFLRRMDPRVLIVFVTHYGNRAIDGYEVEASAFLVKPLTYPALERVMERLRRRLELFQEKQLVLKNARGLLKISLDSIRYIEAVGHYVRIHRDSQEVMFLTSMKELERQLEGQPFFRCSSGVIVSLERVGAVNGYQVEVEGVWLPVGRTKRKELLAALNEYLSGR